jgi:hypothetical protein
MNKRKLSLLAGLTATTLLAACGGGGDGTSPQANGTLHVALTDAPACGFDEVNVTVQKIRVHQSASANENDSGWTDITLSPARKINLLDLTNGALEELGQTPLAAGHYTQLRLVLDPNTGSGMANSVVLTTDPANSTEIPLVTPSAVQSGIKLVNGFDVEAGQRVDLVLDFDACKSIVARGNGKYGLKPVVKVIPTVLNGISGFIDPALLDDNVMVTAQQDGVIVRATSPNRQTGEFFLARMEPGNYDVVVTAEAHATAVIATVPVASPTSTVNLSSQVAPLILEPAGNALPRSISGTVTLPADSSEVAFVAAQQRFAAGPKVTVKYQGADVSGAYTLSSLPTIAPRLAQYSATLPLAFTAQTSTTPGTGKYAVEASAAGFVSKSVPSVDLTTGDKAGVNFTLP